MSEAPDAKKDSPMPAASTIYVIRHAEKPDAGKGLAPAGRKRAEAYVTYLQNLTSPTGAKIHWDHIFASEDSNSSDRAVLTVTPLANALNKKIHSQYEDKDYERLSHDLRQNRAEYAGQSLLICWHHGKILELAQAFGASCKTLPEPSAWPSTWPGDVYGWLLKLYFDEDGALDSGETVAVNESLMPDDTVAPVYCK